MILRIPSKAVRKQRRLQRKQRWHKWFAWYPLRRDDDTVYWLCMLERAWGDNQGRGKGKWSYRPSGWQWELVLALEDSSRWVDVTPSSYYSLTREEQGEYNAWAKRAREVAAKR